ncbi:hypothetical protein V2A60_005470 [Cordyceps javanica]
MSASVQEWSAVEVRSSEVLPGSFLGLLEWVLDESALAHEDDSEEESGEYPSHAVENASLVIEERVCRDSNKAQDNVNVTSPVKAPLPGSIPSNDSPPIEGEANDPVDRDHESIKSVNTARKGLLELASKWKIPSEAIQDKEHTSSETKDSTPSWSISAIGEDPTPPPNKNLPAQENGTQNPFNHGSSPMVEELHSSSNPRSLSIAAWVMDTTEGPVPNLIAPKAGNAPVHCSAIDPETGDFLPAIEHPETKFHHNFNLQSEPAYRRGDITSDMQISRELKARAKLAQRFQERHFVQEGVQNAVQEEAESPFPRADCTIRPATDDDIEGILETINSERQTSEENCHKTSVALKPWNIVGVLNKCKKDNRPFIVATGGEDDLLDRSKWPAGADRAYKEYVKYLGKSAKRQATIVGFAFAMPRESSSFDARDIHIDHSCNITLFVHPSHKGKKYGSALLDRILMSVSPIHRSLIDFEWKCDDAVGIYEQLASNNVRQYARVFVEYLDAHDEDQRLPSRKKLLENFGFSQVGRLSCLKSELREGKTRWLDLFVWELEAQALENVR